MTTTLAEGAPALEEWEYEETEGERSARENTQIELSETSQGFVDDLVTKLVKVANDIAGEDAILRPYQEPFVRRLFESLIISDGARITALFSRQSGKTEAVADVVVTAMIMLPLLARAYPAMLGKFKQGIKVGVFAPVEDQAM